MNRIKGIWHYSTAILLGLMALAGWEVGARVYDKPFILPSPSGIMLKLWELKDVLFTVHLLATLEVILLGLGISIVFGVSLAVLMNRSQLAERTFFPFVIASQTIPIIALAPIFVIWFGYTIWSKVAVTVLITFFPITVSTFDGLRAASKELQDLLKTMGASPAQIFRKVQLPSSLPYFFSGLKVAVTLSVIGAAIGEWLGASKGLGYFSRRMMTQMDGAGVFAPIVLLSALGIILFLLIKLIENILTNKWRQ
ncbi:ABC transporter permease [Salipaludibacillus agaradhaerens]|uniref:ABC transporter permease n=1 Tax=Salipaludibacillus agaradhaerens TaxID=76935 RepID=A0A9Q4FZ87_SALAG|nr:ABC transporter permease [Salipaludibacillus agaradhaerens]MCR6098520.1 ABC transporter permease [Salipaludibacillus agaradhaerens]MCR6115527.1 ABC transporter permease [Salipaludibacillus agaradhaerens]UJW59243.1 ABC transporter permease [Bacillus sp. A116_S68]